MINILFTEQQEILQHLIDYKVSFILVGGYAVIYHGYPRTTGDMDLWLQPDNENKNKLINALADLDFDSSDLHHLGELDFSKPIHFTIGNEPIKLDFMTFIQGVDYIEANRDKVIAHIDGLELPIIQYNHLILSKMNTDRLKDKADIEELQKRNR